MPASQVIFAGVDLSSGRKPVTFAALDEELNVKSLEQWDVSEALSGLKEYENAWLVLDAPSRLGELHKEFRKKISQVGFQAYSKQSNPKQWLETNAQDSLRLLGGHSLFPPRSLEGRLQRSAILYERGLQIKDPIDVFEEITRYKLIQGILPLEKIYSSKELDALVAAYLAWMAVNRPGQIVVRAGFVLPAQE